MISVLIYWAGAIGATREKPSRPTAKPLRFHEEMCVACAGFDFLASREYFSSKYPRLLFSFLTTTIAVSHQAQQKKKKNERKQKISLIYASLHCCCLISGEKKQHIFAMELRGKFLLNLLPNFHLESDGDENDGDF